MKTKSPPCFKKASKHDKIQVGRVFVNLENGCSYLIINANSADCV